MLRGVRGGHSGHVGSDTPIRGHLSTSKKCFFFFQFELFELTLRFRFEMERCVYLMVSGLRARMSSLM